MISVIILFAFVMSLVINFLEKIAGVRKDDFLDETNEKVEAVTGSEPSQA